MGVHSLHHISSPSRCHLGVHETSLKYCEISVYVEILNWHTADSALEYSNFPFLKITEKCRYCIKHSETQCKVNLEKKSGTNISLKGGQLKSCKLRDISEHEDIARAYNIVEKFKIHLRKDIFLPCL